LYKQAEIRVREEEIKVIEDIIQFIDEFQSKHSTKSNNPSSSTRSTTMIDLTRQQGLFIFLLIKNNFNKI
jgi:hypothetical protein